MILKHIKLRWLSLYLSIQRLTEVFVPVKRYFLEQHEDCPMELKTFFELDEATCVLSFLQSILFDLHKKTSNYNVIIQQQLIYLESFHQLK